ncbi:unnamed protein product [Rangifer tarandus platyrhynchus]|uniref:Uncharacterized protein n=1 Tax=Rangifer tarandus platyrhynchus TaxID=3082113 RepID=A0AC59ZZE5_RANTA
MPMASSLPLDKKRRVIEGKSERDIDLDQLQFEFFFFEFFFFLILQKPISTLLRLFQCFGRDLCKRGLLTSSSFLSYWVIVYLVSPANVTEPCKGGGSFH